MTKTSQLIKVKISMYFAFIGGVFVPLLETVRRWHQESVAGYFVTWFEDYAIGALLLLGGWKTYKSIEKGRKYLTASWGVATGMGFEDFFSQLEVIHRAELVSGSNLGIAIIKGVIFLICALSLVFSLVDKSSEAS